MLKIIAGLTPFALPLIKIVIADPSFRKFIGLAASGHGVRAAAAAAARPHPEGCTVTTCPTCRGAGTVLHTPPKATTAPYAGLTPELQELLARNGVTH